MFERCINDKLIKHHINKLADSQCGFRENRNCLQQIFTLHESMMNGKTEVALLDQTAAYDSVNRQLLWNKLYEQFQVPKSTINILKLLFENNHSRLAIKNKLSKKIHNTCGLLQGSSLSPILFNFFNNDLLVQLHESEGVKTYGIKITNLAFADDIALIANNSSNLQKAVRIAEIWAIKNSMKFNPKKCNYIGHSTKGPKIYDVEIKKCDRATYLGVIFSNEGIDTLASAQERARRANLRTIIFRKLGMNVYGLTAQTASFIYATYIRPMLEYGIQFMCEKGLDTLQKAQNNALRAIFSANRNSSTAALHLLSKIPMLKTRQLILQTGFFGMLHNNNDGSIPAVKIWWNGLLSNRNKSSMISKSTARESLFSITPKRNHTMDKLTKNHPNIQPTPIVTPQVREAALIKGNKTMKITKKGIADSLEEDMNAEHRWILKDISLPTQLKVDVIRWLVGNVCWHRKCLKCDDGTELSRQHGLECSGAYKEMKIIYDNEYINFSNENSMSNTKHTLLDEILARARDFPNPYFYALVSRWIAMIQMRCLKFKRDTRGGWFDPNKYPDQSEGITEDIQPLTTE